MIGKRFGRWTVIGKAKKPFYYNVKCACGNKKAVYKSSLVAGDSKSCGCLKAEVLKQRKGWHNVTHGMTKTPVYRSWTTMKTRCLNPNNWRYKDYGGRDIIICDRWLNSFESFYKDMGKRPTGTTLDRINNSGNYEPSNCKWSTPKEQSSNMRNNRILEYRGISLTIPQWARKFNMRYATLYRRIYKGWPTERALFTV